MSQPLLPQRAPSQQPSSAASGVTSELSIQDRRGLPPGEAGLYLAGERLEQCRAGSRHATTYEDEFRVHEEDVAHQGPAQGNDGVLEDSVGYGIAGCRPADDASTP